MRDPVAECFRLASRILKNLRILERLSPLVGDIPTPNSKQMPAQAATASGACLTAVPMNAFTEYTTRIPSWILSIFAAALSVLRRPSRTRLSIWRRASSGLSPPPSPTPQAASSRSSLNRTASYAATSFGSSSLSAS